MKKIWDEIGVLPVTEQRLADQVRQIRTKKWFIDIEIIEIRRQWERNNSTVEAQEDDQEIIEHNENKQSQLEQQGAQEFLVEQGHESEQQQETHHISSFPEDDEILPMKAETESHSILQDISPILKY